MVDTNGPNLSAIKTRLLSGSVDQPVVFHELISCWPSMQWNPAELTHVFSEQTFKFRLGRRHSDGKFFSHQLFFDMYSLNILVVSFLISYPVKYNH